jgi:iron complex outermembrane receptor protein
MFAGCATPTLPADSREAAGEQSVTTGEANLAHVSSHSKLLSTTWRCSAALIAVTSSVACYAQSVPTKDDAQSVPTKDDAQSVPTKDDRGLTEIIVTARKRTESLISVPVAVTALGAADLNRYAASDLTKISQLAPQVIVTSPSGGGQGTGFTIRGIGSSTAEVGLESSVPINLDGVQQSRGRLAIFSMFDIAQVEVLKGPQALFFGKNSPAGVISLQSSGPTNRFHAGIMAGYEFVADERYVEAYVSGPITSTLKARLAVRASEIAGWVRNRSAATVWPIAGPGFPLPGASSKRAPNGHQVTGRLTVAYEPTPDFDATLRILAGKQRGDSDTSGQETICAGVPATFGQPDPTGDCRLNRIGSVGGTSPRIVQNWPLASKDGSQFTRTDVFIGGLTMNYKLNDVTLTSVSSFTHLNYLGFDNFTFTSFPDVFASPGENNNTYTQELRASSKFDGPLNFMLGAYYEQYKRRNTANTMIFFVGQDPATGRYLSYLHPSVNKGTTYSAFGQLRWAIRDDLELSGGVRFSSDKRSVDTRNDYVNPLFSPAIIDLLPAGQSITGKQTDSNWSPEASLAWHPTKDSTLYLAYKSGYKAGGFANPAVLARNYTTASIEFNSEKAEGGEIGYKAELFDRTLRIELTGYYYTFSNLQLSSFENTTFSYFIKNAGEARTKGVEASAEWRATHELTLRSALAYNHARYVSFPTSACYQQQTSAEGCVGGVTQDLAGKHLARAPDWVASVGATYDTRISRSLMLGLSADTRYSSSYFTDYVLSPIPKQDGFFLLNAAARLYTQDETWELSLIGRNLTNKLYITDVQDMPGGNPGSFGAQVERPREFLVQGKFRF